MTAVATKRRCNLFSVPSVLSALVIVSCLYFWTLKLEHRSRLLSALLEQIDGGEHTDGSSPTEDDVGLDWELGETSTGGVQVHARPPPGVDLEENVSEEESQADPVPNEGSRMLAHEFGIGAKIENAATDPLINETWHSSSTPDDLLRAKYSDCRSLPGSEDVLLVMKTGSTELLRRVPVHLLTTFTCVQDYMIFSSLAQFIGGVPVYDALANVSEATKSSDETLRTLYPKLKEYQHKAWDVSKLAQEGSWALDKWKNLPMAIEAYRRYPKKKWFVFMDADSAVLWSNLLHLLSRLDSKKPMYLGSPVYIDDTLFAHGGSGYIVSGVALAKIVESETKRKEAWEQRTAQICCGDMMFAEALRDVGVGLTDMAPAAFGSAPRDVLYNEKTWCQSPVFFHHMGVNEVEELWEWEQNWAQDNGRNNPALFGDMFYHFTGQYILSAPEGAAVEPPFPTEQQRLGWDNHAAKLAFERSSGENAPLSPEQDVLQPYANVDLCRERCEAETWCVQYRWRTDVCSLGDTPGLGRDSRNEWNQLGEEFDHMTSGWLEGRIAEYLTGFGECTRGGEFDVSDKALSFS